MSLPFSYSIAFVSWSVTTALSTPVFAQDLETIEITGHHSQLHLTGELKDQLAQHNVNSAGGGGLSALPVLNGMMGDRIQVLADGVPVTAACGNQMNPPLSYIAATQVSQIQVMPTVSKVSEGGDNIAGVVSIDTQAPAFTTDDTLSWDGGSAGFQYRSVNHAQVYHLNGQAASKHWFAGYSGNIEKADSYDNGDGEQVLDTLYKAENHAITLGYQDADRLATVKYSHQSVPYQGFPGQYMDMVDNRTNAITADYQQQFDSVTFNGLLSLRNIKHEMGFFTDEKPGTMPMLTDSQDLTAKLAWTLALEGGNTLKIGQEFYLNKLNDDWPAVAGSMMMGPDNYVNINDGRRQRTAIYAQWSQQPSEGWHYSAGMRVEQISTQAGEVQPYNNMSMADMMMANADALAAQRFNAADRDQSDTLVDVTLLATRRIDDEQSLTLGVARKNRAPNLYERYTWGQGMMSSSMIGWFNDGNAYVGNINLKPETAHTASVSYRLEQRDRALTVDAWYTRVSDYIDGQPIGQFVRSAQPDGVRNQLRFTNLDATFKGVTIKGVVLLADNDTGRWQLGNNLSWQDGERNDTDESLYQIVPWQNTLTLSHNWDSWESSLQWQWVGEKDEVDPRRLENRTASYALLDLSTRYDWASWSFELAVNNITDKTYQLPLAGVSVADFRRDPANGFAQLDGPGRSFNVGVTYRF